ncbi:MAG: tail fiber domain-containing protein [Akkermansiaceae bacterium]
MKLRNLQSLCAALLTLCPMLIHAQTSAVPNYISYQGFVVDASGNGVGAGTPVNRTVIFRIWDHQSSVSEANLIFSEQQTVTVSEGEFSVLVGQGVANTLEAFGYSETTKKLADLGDAFNGSGRYLGVTVASSATIATTDNEISPRQQIVSTAFAMRAKFAESISSSSDLRFSPTGGTVSNYGLGWYGLGRTFSGTAVDGPVLYGNAGGALGSNASDIQKTALLWDASGRVGIGATSFSSNTNKLTLEGDMAATPADQLTIRGNSENGKRLLLGYDTTANRASLQSYNSTTNTSPLLLNPQGGNVGINKDAPTVALDVEGTISASGRLDVAGDAIMNSNVGIGTSTPKMKLAIADGASDNARYGSLQITRETSNHTAAHMAFVRAGSAVMGLGYQQNSNWFGFGVGTTGAFSPSNLRMDGSRVLIHSSSTTARLNVGAINASYTSYGRLTTNGGKSDNTNRTNTPLSIRASGHIMCPTFDIDSDERIKTAIEPSDSREDLGTLLGIEIADYKYIDTIANGNKPQKKVIAQQVENVFPQAINKSTGSIPDIFKSAEIADGWVLLATDLKVGERVRLIGEKDEAIEEVIEVRGDAFRTAFKPSGDQVFVHGREVEDYRTVDYDAIAMLNVSATQQIKKEKDAEIQALRNENAALRRELTAKNASLEARLIALERSMPKAAAIETVSLTTSSASE